MKRERYGMPLTSYEDLNLDKKIKVKEAGVVPTAGELVDKLSSHPDPARFSRSQGRVWRFCLWGSAGRRSGGERVH